MNNRVRLQGFEGFRKEFKITDITYVRLNVPACERLPTTKAVVDGRDGCEGVQSKLVVKEATRQAVNYGNFIIFARKVKGSGPSTVAITTNYHDSLRLGASLSTWLEWDPDCGRS